MELGIVWFNVIYYCQKNIITYFFFLEVAYDLNMFLHASWASPSSVMIICDEEVCIVTILSIYACNNALINIGFSAEMEIRMALAAGI